MISIKSRSYIDHLGRTLQAPVGNQGDEGTYITEYSMYCGIVLTPNTPVTLVAGSPARMVLSGIENGWSSLGISQGDSITFLLENNDGSANVSGTFAVAVVDGDDLVLASGFPIGIDGVNGHVFVNKAFEAFDMSFNLVPHDQNGLEQSFIDDTTVVLQNDNIAPMAVGNTYPLTQVGNKSGGIIRNATIKRNANTSIMGGILVRNYQISVKFVWWGYLSMWNSQYFQDIRCVTPLVRVSFYPKFNDKGTALSYIFKPSTDGNSGFRNENYNQNPNNFSIQSFVWKDVNDNVISAFDYTKDNKFELNISSTVGFGDNFGLIFFNNIQDQDLFSYNPDDPNNVNGTHSHDQHTILGQAATLTQTTGQSFISALGINGEQYTFLDVDISVTGVTATITGKVSPNQAFKDKFLDENNTNKQFALLVRCEGDNITSNNYIDTVNNLAWLGNGEVSPVILGTYPMVNTVYDHVRGVFGGEKGFPLIIEDDVRVESQLKFKRGVVHKGLRFCAIARNTVSGDWFELEAYNFAFDETILVGGVQNVEMSFPMYYANLFPPTALNTTLKIVREPSQDTVDEYAISLLLPSLIRWESWLTQQNVALQFYNEATKDWRNYEIANWTLAMMIEIEVEEGVYRNINDVNFEDYDHNSDIDITFEFEREDGTPITTPLIGEVIKVRAIIEDVNGDDIDENWGMITVEPFEASPRYVISSYYDHGLQPYNPLYPTITGGDKLEVSGWGTPTVTMECMFDPNKLNTQNGVSFTARIQPLEPSQAERHKKSFPLVQLPFVPNDQGKDGDCCDCEPELKLGDADSNELIKNDIISHVHLIAQPDTETVQFKIYKDGELLPNFGVYKGFFPNEPNARSFTWNVRDYIITYGEGCYECKKAINPAGIAMEISLGKYKFRQYSTESAEGTVRALVLYDLVTLFEENGMKQTINFAGSGYEDSFRFKGYFGNWQPNMEVTNHYSNVRQNRTANLISKETYELQMIGATFCDRQRMWRLALHSSQWRMSDHNESNPDQRLIMTNCVLSDENTLEVGYFAGSRKMQLDLILTAQNENSVSRFGGTNQLPLGVASVLQTIGASNTPNPSVCNPVTVNVKNSLGQIVDSVTFPAGVTGNASAPDATILIKDALGNVVDTLTAPSNGTIDYIQNLGGDGEVKIYNTYLTLLDTVYVAPNGSISYEVDYTTVHLRNSSNIILSSYDFDSATPNNYIDAPDAVVQFELEDGTPAGNTSVPSGETTVVTIPDAPPAPTGYTSMSYKTGQVVSKRTGDDGDTQRGRPFFTLPIINSIQKLNYFESKWRFTGITGGYYDRDTSQYRDVNGNITTRALAFPHELRCDWGTLDWNNDFIMWYFPDLNSQASSNWDDAIDWANSLAVNSFNDLYLPNTNELLSLRHISYAFLQPLELVGSLHNIWSSSNPNTGYAEFVGLVNTLNESLKSTTSLKRVAMRIGNISEL